MLSILATCEENKCHFNTAKIFHIFVVLMKKFKYNYISFQVLPNSFQYNVHKCSIRTFVSTRA